MQQIARAMEESLQQVKAEIKYLEQKSDRPEGKVQAHYQERLKELCHTQETLEGDPIGLRMEETPGALTPLISSSQDILGLDATTIPMEPEMLSASPPRVSRSPSSQERP